MLRPEKCTENKTEMEPTYEEALKELQEIIKKIESGNVKLAEVTDLFKRGLELQKYCQKKLDELNLVLEKCN